MFFYSFKSGPWYRRAPQSATIAGPGSRESARQALRSPLGLHRPNTMSDEIIINVDGSSDAETKLVISDKASLIDGDFHIISSTVAVVGEQYGANKQKHIIIVSAFFYVRYTIDRRTVGLLD